MDEQEAEMYIGSPTDAGAPWQGFERSIDAHISASADERLAGYSSSDAEAIMPSQSLPRHRDRAGPSPTHRRTSQMDYSGAEHGSYSDFSDSANGGTARMSALSLANTDPRPSTSSTHAPIAHAVYGTAPARPSIGARNPSQMSGIGTSTGEEKKATVVSDDERIVYHGWIYLLKSRSGVRQWKRVWMVLRPKQLTFYKDEGEYTAQLIIPFNSIIDVVEIDPISKSKTACMQIISEERNYRFCALDEESLAKWLGAFKSLLSKRKAKVTEGATT